MHNFKTLNLKKKKNQKPFVLNATSDFSHNNIIDSMKNW